MKTEHSLRLEVEKQPSLFDEPKLEPFNEEWLYGHWLEFDFHPKSNEHAEWFGRNVWTLLSRSKYWSDIQYHVIDAHAWLISVAKSYDDFSALALDESTPFYSSLYELLRDVYDSEEQLINAALKRFFGYSLDDYASGGWPDPETVGWGDRLIDEEASARGCLKQLFRETIGADELILNFYRDPFSWAERLKGDALPGASEQNPLELPEYTDKGELLRAVDKLFDVFI